MNIIINNQLIFVLSLLLLINLYSLYLMASDKFKAINSSPRTPEGVIFFWAVCFGSLGVFLGMFLFRHKKRKWYFYFGVPLAILENMALLCLVAWYLGLIE